MPWGQLPLAGSQTRRFVPQAFRTWGVSYSGDDDYKRPRCWFVAYDKPCGPLLL